MKKTRFGIVGTGRISDWVLKGAVLEPRFEAAAVCSRTKENAEDYIEATRVNLEQNSNGDRRIQDLTKYIFPVELKNDGHYKKFGIEEVFTSLYNKYENEKFNKKITACWVIISL